MLVKDLGASYGGAGTTAAGASVVRQTIASLLGIHPKVVDGSGLSPADVTSPYQVADLLVELAPTPIGSVLRGDLAVAGQTGTLATRMRHTAAAGRCEGKTGTLTGVSNLVGYCQSSDGHLLAFAIFTDAYSDRSRPHFPRSHDDHDCQLLIEQPAKARLVEHRDHAEALGLLELRPCALARNHVVGLLRDRPGHPPPGGHDPLGGLLARELRQGPGQHERLARQRPL